ncbi:anti-sigma factor [Streptomyces sp. Je 1-332]|uniref:anti-sigma factor n=1 Tax=Streptomyces sp. Je 1-332 TaxID=3231270 RepID=UPI00345A43D6
MSVIDPHTLAAAYALHALPPDEVDAFETHLDSCGPCRQEVAEFLATAAQLTAPAAPPPSLKQSVLDQIAKVPQEPAHASRPPELQGSTGWLGRSGRWASGAGRWTLAACLAAAALGGVATWQHQEARDAREQANQARAQADQVAAVLAAPDAKTRAAALSGGARGVVVTSESQNRAVFTVSGLDAPPGDKVYEMWFNDRGTMRAAGLLESRSGDQTVLMDGTLQGATGMGLTIEPAGGSRTPTLPPVGLIEFPA